MKEENIEIKKEKIVIIEGAEPSGGDIVNALKADGYESVYLYKNGEEGFKGVLDTLPHLILLDIVLPDTDGYSVLKKKQQEPLLNKIPVLLLSMHGVAINMKDIPENSITEVLISLDTKTKDVVNKVNRLLGHPVSEDGGESEVTNKKKLLWIEDDKLIGTILEKKLISSGFDLIHSKNGEDALKALESFKPDIIVIDLILPGMNGFEILEKMKEIESLKGVPRMVLSNLSKVSDIDKAKSLGVSKYLVKASTSLDQVIAEIRDISK